MSYLWKKRNGIASKMNGDKEGIEKMNNFRKTFQTQIDKQSQSYDGDVTLVSKVKKKQTKRFRSAFTTMQISLLEKEFKKDPYVTNVRREHVANALNLPERAVKIWFQNRRMKEKRDLCKGAFETDEDVKHPVRITINKDMITKLTGTSNQQTASTSLAAKIVFTNDEISKVAVPIRNDNYRMSILDVIESNNIKQAIDKVKPEKHLVITKTEEDEPLRTSSSEQNITLASNINNKQPVKDNDFYQTKKKSPPKQPVGHIQPFSQVSAIAPQRSPQNLSTSTGQFTNVQDHTPQVSTPHINETPDHTSQCPAAFPIELSKYYSSVPPIYPPPWNRYVVPVMPANSQGLPLYAPPPPPMANAGPTKCSCDCHLTASMDTMGYPQHPMFYTQYIPHYIAPLPQQNTSSKF